MFQFRPIALNLVFFLNVLLIFLLVFEDKVQVPLILQVTGRMHPLLLHFPLVLLFVGIFLEFLISFKKFQHPAIQEITTYFFYLFALTAAFTALFGFFLYREGSYPGEEVTLHKWLGTIVSVLALVIISIKEKSRTLYYSTLGISAVCLVLAGHVGAEVTHGKGFLTEPIVKRWKARSIQIDHPDSAVIFRDVIQPILNEKCLNCHNHNKAKNNLILADYEGIMNGGKQAGALVPGNAEESLIYQYALLPMDDSLHMPPSDKLQLDQDEIKLIGWWIDTGANAFVKYADLPKPDSIHPFMLSRFQPKTGLDLIDIPFADNETISDLNNPYRTVQQIAATKPYVAVFLGSKKNFTPDDLNELRVISRQIISIDIGNSEASDDDIQNLSQFPHLQKLHLQNIAIGDDGVKQLKDLRYLNVLNLSGTKITGKTLEELSEWNNLKKLYVYNTAVPDGSVKALKEANPELEIYNTQFDLTDSLYTAQLTIPVCKIDSSFFRSTASVEVKLSRGKVKYYYTLDGTEPGPESMLYNGPFKVSQSAELKIMAAMDGWVDSDVISFPLVKLGIRPGRVILETKPDPRYSGKLDSTLVDGKSAGPNRTDKNYLGFVNQNFQVLFQMDKPEKISQLSLSFLEAVEDGVYAPARIEVWGGDDKTNLLKLADVTTETPHEKKPASKRVIRIDFPQRTVRFIRLRGKRPETLLARTAAQNKTDASIFVDEVALE